MRASAIRSGTSTTPTCPTCVAWPVIAFALRPEAEASLTPRYSHALGANFRPRRDYRAAIASADRPMEVLVGARDELFEPQGYAPEFDRRAVPVKVTVVPGLGHIGLALEPAGHAAILLALERLAGAPH